MAMPTTGTALTVAGSPSTVPRRTAAKEVAVIGAGAAGLVAAREMRREGHRVVVFERGDTVGGTWAYTPEVESDDLLGVHPNRRVVQSSLYRSLRTNLPREVMGFLDYPFKEVPGRDGRRFPGHEEVLAYLSDFARDFNLVKCIRFKTDVFHVSRVPDGKWLVQSRKVFDDDVSRDVNELFDGVLVCNGHYTEPRIAEIPGVNRWPGKQIHSHNYRVPKPFQGKVVVIIGSAASATDISRDISPVAKEVHVSSRSASDETTKRQPGYNNMWLHPMIQCTFEDGTVIFNDGTSVIADVILHCTGYKYYFPFLDTNGVVTVDDNRVGPLYKHVFPPSLAPSLAFIGIPWKVVPFPLSELQSKWVAGILSGRIALPTEQEMMEDVEAFYAQLEATAYPIRYTHNMAGYQFEYDDWLATQCGYPKVENWRRKMYTLVSKRKRAQPETYRDEWDDHDLVLHAQEHFLSLVTLKM